MTDNIRNFNDYRKKINKDDQFTEEINIEIQDPLDFLSAEEREEYYRTQHEAMDRERESLKKDSPEFYLDEDEDYYTSRKNSKEEIIADSLKSSEEEIISRKSAREDKKVISRRTEKKVKSSNSHTASNEPFDHTSDKKKKSEKIKEEKPKAIRRKTRIEDIDDFEDEEVNGRGINPLLIVRISSIITGIIILALIGMIFKAKFYDRYLVPDPDEDTTKVEVGELAGYTRTDDKVITTSDLNLRNTPSTASKDFVVVQVPKDTVLDRIAVSDDGEWAQVKYEDQLLFCVMKYLTVQE